MTPVNEPPVKFDYPKYKNVIYMYYFEDYKANEIAGILNIPVNTVYSLLKRGKEKLKGVLDESL